MKIRSYHQARRAQSTRRTREHLIEAAVELFSKQLFEATSLNEIAAAAGTTPQTLLRHFGSKEGLFQSALQASTEQVRREREAAPVGDIPGAVANLAEHYRQWGERVLRLLAREDASAQVRRVTDTGRTLHAEWVERTFGPQLDRHRGNLRSQKLDGLIALTDVYVWKVLCLDRKRTTGEYASLLEGLIRAVVEG
ncbi:MAG: TetR/AcrR family transcriptional regulator [Armatimonadetes bacterium]|nr:TetR/AcrR family transcriptional regulator [Armatimonadota bacterium]